MRTARIGSLEVSVVGVGCNNFGRALDRDASAAVVHAALDQGVTYFDTARVYGEGLSESFLGAALGARRDEVIVGTKFGRVPQHPDDDGADAAAIARAVETSLSELGTDYIDLYQLHFPDPDTPLVETLGALQGLVDEGKVREIGCSNFTVELLGEAQTAATEHGLGGFVSDQVHYSMLHRQPEVDGLGAFCVSRGVALLPYYPLANGLLTGKTRRGEQPQGRLGMQRYRRFLTDENFDVVERVGAFGLERGLSPVEVALGWLLTRPAVPAVTPGATRPEQVAANVGAADWRPTAHDLAILDRILDPGAG